MNLKCFTGRSGGLDSGRSAGLKIPIATAAPGKDHCMARRNYRADRHELRLCFRGHPAHGYPVGLGTLRNRHCSGRDQRRKEHQSGSKPLHQRSMIGTHCELPHLTAANHAVPV
jgi:hypothetical protein